MVTAQLGRAAVMDVATVLLAVLSAVLLIRFRTNSAWLILAGGLAGIALRAFS
jgi:chromate transporter